MWHIISDNKTPVEYLVVHETKGRTDKFLGNYYNIYCWAPDLIYDRIRPDTTPEILDDFLEDCNYSILHSFESDDPLTYLQNLPSIHPEFFI